jgi:pectate lyase
VNAGTGQVKAEAKDGSGVSALASITVKFQDVAAMVTISEAKGWLNAAWLKWNKLSGAEGYNVYYKGGAVSSYTKIDEPLIREYPNYFRADIPGLAAGAYDLKVYPVFSGVEGASGTETSVIVASHDRSGYAFANNKVPGGYKLDGTPKANARIIYVTDQNKDTVTLGVNADGKGDVTQTGIQKIIDGHKKGNETRPLIIRLIGQIRVPANSYAGDVMFETKNAAGTYITLEGIGDDATADGWGVRMKNASNIEISNIGFMNTASDEGDDVGLQQKNYYIWVHNCDLFYGKPGGDSDQAKGDGAMDSKGSTYVTFSYNHFWDTGKTHLIGNKEEGPDGGAGLLTLHHNWYDHSDSRHPRVRVHTVHVYNNYYDGVSKYGIGATYGGSVFAEGNYYRNTKYPMLISMQGSDVYDSAKGANDYTNMPTFSKEDGGIIKAYNNYMTGQTRFVAYGASGSPNSTVDFDAYVAANRSDTVPGTVTTYKGGNPYNNFDTASGFYAYTADSPEAAKTKVMEFAGRMSGGDFTWTFTNPADDTSYDVNTALQSALTGYTTTLVSVQGGGSAGGGGGNAGDGGDGDGGDEEGGGITDSVVSTSFTKNGPTNPAFTVTGNYSDSKGTVTVNGTSYTICLKMESSTEVSFITTQPMTLTLYFANTETGKKVKINGVQYTTNSGAKVEVSLSAGTHTITKGDSINLYYISLSE